LLENTGPCFSLIFSAQVLLAVNRQLLINPAVRVEVWYDCQNLLKKSDVHFLARSGHNALTNLGEEECFGFSALLHENNALVQIRALLHKMLILLWKLYFPY
jgi:hypothetical protein